MISRLHVLQARIAAESEVEAKQAELLQQKQIRLERIKSEQEAMTKKQVCLAYTKRASAHSHHRLPHLFHISVGVAPLQCIIRITFLKVVPHSYS